MEKDNVKKRASKKEKKIFGLTKVGEKGQIVIPKEARDMFDIKPGDTLLLLGDPSKGIAIVKADFLDKVADETFGEAE